MITMIWMACGGQGPITTSELPQARVGDVYQAAIELDGKLRGEFFATGLPEGLTLHPDLGVISGVPQFRGDYPVTVEVQRKGEVTEARDYTLVVRNPDRNCALNLSGRWEGSSTASAFESRPLAESDHWRAVPLPIPDDDVEEITFQVNNARLYLTRPGVTFDERAPFEEQFVRIPALTSVPDQARVGWDTGPHLGAYQALSEVPTLILAAPSPADWSLSASCTRGPVISQSTTGPFRLGDAVLSSFTVTKYREDVTFEPLDALPTGLTLREDGILIGKAEVAGQHVFRMRATRTTNGLATEAAVGFGIWEPVALDCGQTISVQAEPPDAAFAELSPEDQNIDRFTVVETPWAGQAGLFWEVTGDFERAGLLEPLSARVNPLESGLTDARGASPDTWPAIDYFSAFPRARFIVASEQIPIDASVTLSCADRPRPGVNQPPILTAETPTNTQLSAIGGEEPWSWEAIGLPASVALLEDGTLVHDGTDFGVVDVDFVVTDGAGMSATTRLPLASSTQAACGPDAVVLSCGGEVTFALEGQSTAIACLPPGEFADADWVQWSYDAPVVEFDSLPWWVLLHPGRFDAVLEELYGFLTVADNGYLLARGSGDVTMTRGTLNLLGDLELREGQPLALLAASRSELPSQVSVAISCGTGFPP